MVAGGFRPVARQHGSREVVVRGTVIKALPARRRSGWFGLFLPTLHPEIHITIDAEPHAKLQQLLQNNTNSGGVSQTFHVGWGAAEQEMPKTDDRVWITFGYAAALEQFFHGAPHVSLKGIEVIPNEWAKKEGEIIEDQPSLFPAGP